MQEAGKDAQNMQKGRTASDSKLYLFLSFFFNIFLIYLAALMTCGIFA